MFLYRFKNSKKIYYFKILIYDNTLYKVEKINDNLNKIIETTYKISNIYEEFDENIGDEKINIHFVVLFNKIYNAPCEIPFEHRDEKDPFFELITDKFKIISFVNNKLSNEQDEYDQNVINLRRKQIQNYGRKSFINKKIVFKTKKYIHKTSKELIRREDPELYFDYLFKTNKKNGKEMIIT